MQKQKLAMKNLIFALAAGIISISCNESELKTLQKSCVEDKLNAACEKLCDLNKSDGADGCLNLALFYEFGKGVEQDFTKAFKLYEKACDLDYANGCNNLGVLYANGQGVKPDSTKANKLFNKACDLGSQLGCDVYIVLTQY